MGRRWRAPLRGGGGPLANLVDGKLQDVEVVPNRCALEFILPLAAAFCGALEVVRFVFVRFVRASLQLTFADFQAFQAVLATPSPDKGFLKVVPNRCALELTSIPPP